MVVCNEGSSCRAVSVLVRHRGGHSNGYFFTPLRSSKKFTGKKTLLWDFVGRFYLSTVVVGTYATVHVPVMKKYAFFVRLLCHDSLHLLREGENHPQHHRSRATLPGLHSRRQGKFVPVNVLGSIRTFCCRSWSLDPHGILEVWDLDFNLALIWLLTKVAAGFVKMCNFKAYQGKI